MLTLLYLAAVAVAQPWADPLPKPRSIKWDESSGSKLVSGGLWLDHQPYNPTVSDAFNRMQNTIRELKFYPLGPPGNMEFPGNEFELFPGTDQELPNHDKREEANPMINSVKVSIEDDQADLQLGVDESYTLKVEADSQQVDIQAKTVWGALHAFTTLQQLVLANDDGGFMIEHPVEIDDKPKFPHRGIMLDTARNFLTKKATMRQIDGFALAKLNVLHWHLVDSQAWPIEIESYPEMLKGSYGKNKQFSVQDMKDVVEYARQRGVRVIPELDIPGHSAAGYRHLDVGDKILSCQDSWWSNDNFEFHTAVQPPPGQLNILANETYEVLSNINKDLSKIFTDNVFHAGMDELQTNCYNFSQNIVDYIDEGHTWQDLAQVWIDKSGEILRKDAPNRRLYMWEDAAISEDFSAKNVPKDVIMQSWNSFSNVKVLAEKGYDVVLSNNQWLYLDCGVGSALTGDFRYNVMNESDGTGFNTGLGGSWCAPYKTFSRIYEFQLDFNMTAENMKHVLGAEAPLWAEQSDATTIDNKLWPRGGALGELLWSGNKDDQGNNRLPEFSQRLLNFREYLVEYGINAAPIVPEYCIYRPHHCDLYANQTYGNEFADVQAAAAAATASE